MADIQVILTALLSSDNDTRNQAEVRREPGYEQSMLLLRIDNYTRAVDIHTPWVSGRPTRGIWCGVTP